MDGRVFKMGGQHQPSSRSGPGSQAPPEERVARLSKCLQRTLPPKPPVELPFTAMENNIDQYIVERYASSTFNVCTHQQLPLMKSAPALRLHVDPSATPVSVHRPGNVPAHLMELVRRGWIIMSRRVCSDRWG